MADDSSLSGPESSSSRSPALPVRTLAVVVSALAVAASIFFVVQSRSGCAAVERLSVAVDPSFADVLGEVTTRTDTSCAEFDIEAVDAATMKARLDKGDAPDLWIPAGGWWAQVAQRTADGPVRTVSLPLATSPVTVATAPGATTTTGEPLAEHLSGSGWDTVLSTPGLIFGNPLRSGTASGALLAVLAEAADDPIAMGAVRPLMAPLAQAESVSEEEPPSGQALIDAVLATGGLGITTEQQVLEYSRANGARPDVVVPATGTVLVDYPLVMTSRDPARHDQVTRAATVLADVLHTAPARDTLAGSGFRDGAGRPLADGRGAGPVRILAAPDENVVQETLDTWALTALPVRTIFAVDVSSSMDRNLGTESRIEMVRTAALAANDRLPGSVSAGLWFFGNNVDGRGSDYVQAAPIRRFDAIVDGRSHREKMTELVERMTESSTEGTALYATVLAAYRAVQDSYDPRAANSVVVVTDGTNNVEGLTKDELLDALRSSSDPARPVPIVTIGVGEDVDAATLAEISAVTGGSSYVTNDPLDITDLVVTAIADRTRR